MLRSAIKKDVIIVGAGPVGLLSALFLQKYDIDYILFEKNSKLSTHPSAHYLNMRTMEVFSEIENLHENILSTTESIENFRYYRYCRRLFEENGLFAKSDHFSPSVNEKLRELKNVSFRNPIHLPQFRLQEVLYDHIKNKENILFQHQAINVKNLDNEVETTIKSGQEQEEIKVHSKFLFAADGFHSSIRQKLGLQMLGFPKLQSFRNIFFESKDLANLIINKKEFAMLHFIYNSNICAVLVNHSLKDGLFVLQIPIYPPFDNEKSDPISLILSCLSKECGLKADSFKLKNVGMWNLSGQVAESYHKGRCFLMGDSAHSFPPAGGFGLNTGVQDVHNLIHKIIPSLKKSQSFNSEQFFSQYSRERRHIGLKNLSTAMKYYEKSIEIPRLLGLDLRNLKTFQWALESVPFLPKSMKGALFSAGIKIGSLPIEVKSFEKEKNVLMDENNKIPLIFIEEDVKFSYNEGNGNSGKLLPVFEMIFEKISQASREFIVSVIDFWQKNILKACVNFDLEIVDKNKTITTDYYIIFINGKKEISYEEIKQFLKENINNYKDQSYFLMSSAEKQKNFDEKMNYFSTKGENSNYDRLFSFNDIKFLAVRSDGHIV